MKHLLKYELPGGEAVIAEVDESRPAGEHEATRLEDLALTAGKSLVESLGKLKPIAAAVYESVADLAGASEVSVEFAVKLSGSTNLILTTLGAEANFKVAVKWTRPAQAPAVGGTA